MYLFVTNYVFTGIMPVEFRRINGRAQAKVTPLIYSRYLDIGNDFLDLH